MKDFLLEHAKTLAINSRKALKCMESPFECTRSLKSRFAICIVFGMFTFLFLEIFKPFQLYLYLTNSVGYSFAYAMIALMVMLLFLVLLPKIIPLFALSYPSSYLKFAVLVFFNIVTISLFEWLFSKTYCQSLFPTCKFLPFVFYTSSIGLFPVMFLFLIRLKVNSKKELNNSPFSDAFPEKGLTVLNLSSSDLIFARSNENYILIHFFENGIRKKQIVRMTISNLLSQYSFDTLIAQCHRSYIINMRYVTEVKGNSHTREYFIKSINEKVPVSRKFISSGYLCHNSQLINP